eukprot:Selendium_serpulae@DN6025_c0_g1_i2.p1
MSRFQINDINFYAPNSNFVHPQDSTHMGVQSEQCQMFATGINQLIPGGNSETYPMENYVTPSNVDASNFRSQPPTWNEPDFNHPQPNNRWPNDLNRWPSKYLPVATSTAATTHGAPSEDDVQTLYELPIFDANGCCEYSRPSLNDFETQLFPPPPVEGQPPYVDQTCFPKTFVEPHQTNACHFPNVVEPHYGNQPEELQLGNDFSALSREEMDHLLSSLLSLMNV